MSTQLIGGSISASLSIWKIRGLVVVLCIQVILLSSCSEISKPSSEPFISRSAPPKRQEFRWSNGKTIKGLDPAQAATPPETDIVRALFEGLTELDPKTLEERPAAAEKWSAAEDFRVWTFNLRKNLKWSNGRSVTADDFVRSWRRLAIAAPEKDTSLLTDNIVGMRELRSKRSRTEQTNSGLANESPTPMASPVVGNTESLNEHSQTPENGDKKSERPREAVFGAKAIGPYVLEVMLINPDKDFPRLVAHPMFSPIAGDGSEFSRETATDIPTNGAFKLLSVDESGVTLAPSDQYWNRDAIHLEQVRFVSQPNAEAALQAYRSGEIDALTNADFEPLALKLLTPYSDFRQTIHNALNFYEFNLGQAPYTDRRVREALTIAIERNRLTESEMRGATEPALHLFPFEADDEQLFQEDVQRAKQLLAEAGYPGGENFPPIRLVVNRNDAQQRIARSVARMWKSSLNIDTELITKENSEMDSVKLLGQFDVIRRGLVFPTVDRISSMAAVFLPKPEKLIDMAFSVDKSKDIESSNTNSFPLVEHKRDHSAVRARIQSDPVVLESTLEDAVYEFRIAPLYFPVSYSLVKPYVQGFDVNGLDAPSLKAVTINSDWQPNGQ